MVYARDSGGVVMSRDVVDRLLSIGTLRPADYGLCNQDLPQEAAEEILMLRQAHESLVFRLMELEDDE